MKRIALLVLSMIAPATLASAQDVETGSRIQPKTAYIPEDRPSSIAVAREVTANFAKCLVERYPKDVARTIDLQTGPNGARALDGIELSECLSNGQMTIPQRVMRGAIFVEMYRVLKARNLAVAPQRPLNFNDALDVDFRGNPTRLALLMFADCVVRADEKAAADVILSPTASKQQDAAFKVLFPHLAPCLPQGQQVSLSKPVLEGAIAEVLYRGVAAPVVPTGSK